MARSIWGAIVGCLVAMAACTATDDSNNTNAGDNYTGGVVTSDEGDDGTGTGSSEQPGDTTSGDSVSLATGCPAYGSDVYTPFRNYSAVSSGTPAQFPWRGKSSSYPDGIEDFRAYGATTAAQQSVECGAQKNVRDYLDVTAGCLSTTLADGGPVGEIHGTTEGYYRSFALPYDPAAQQQVAWTDQGVEYRFKYSKWTGDVSNPGFKAFARYLTEYDLYVGSWRMDGVVQIQKKHCGEYTILKRDANYGPPAPNVWHTIRFEVVGSEQRLYLDGRLAMTTTDDTIKHGTAGIRIDSAEGAYIDDWRVYAP